MSSQTQEEQVLALASSVSLLRARDVAALSLPTIILSRLVRDGRLRRVGRGVYARPDQPLSEHISLAEVALRVPRGVICLLSALRIHELGTQAPHQIWLAIPQNSPAPRFDRPSLRPVRMSGQALTEGIQSMRVDGLDVPVFNAAKTIADCFKYRNKIGIDVALEALRDGWEQRKVSLDELSHYADIDRVSNVMRPYMESVVA
ncbi:type IV toxin-antitoxin system AbiEi family antitoxin domain-containing protein [Achromobacter xylosoxidans]|uniref:Transcriptional regulator n=1 Tax=Alcaligenes xylosoxydans xylosoxydans TaxID=85698 RepID=A0A1R1JQR0_ALCXX|nr:type IV toxin-antitoxin system AbiEi family antitoxin domain-containing protein [Achromobacter xylosoxidans]OMG83423.1 transcriptional regulator [Achromobacter xylosoxidans]